MARIQNPNLEILALAVNQLGDLADDRDILRVKGQRYATAYADLECAVSGTDIECGDCEMSTLMQAQSENQVVNRANVR